MHRRRYYKRTPNRDKYSVEQTNINTPAVVDWPRFEAEGNLLASSQVSYPILPPVDDFQGMRKVKHFTLSFSSDDPSTKYYYALVFVPSGYTAQRINIPNKGFAVPFYDANQFVISQGVLDFDGGPLRIRSPLSRNLNSGDSIYLIVATSSAQGPGILVSIRYAVTLQ